MTLSSFLYDDTINVLFSFGNVFLVLIGTDVFLTHFSYISDLIDVRFLYSYE
ncbi:hypothetical protein SAM_0082 [Streptococcus agalactiae CJB111]|nr:hypothetical protein SAM_0082 [Streptococcus agalactiae CJB111]